MQIPLVRRDSTSLPIAGSGLGPVEANSKNVWLNIDVPFVPWISSFAESGRSIFLGFMGISHQMASVSKYAQTILPLACFT